MAIIREGNQAVFIIVDVQVGVIRQTWETQTIIHNIGVALEKARKQGTPVIWVQHSDDELVFGSSDWQIVSELNPAQSEIRINKHFNSAFEQTELEETLTMLKATHIVLAGAATNWCIRATAHSALDRGYDLTLIEDAHTTETLKFGDGYKIEAEAIITELNNAMTWLNYPGRTNRAVLAADLDL
jgi:nicotinamidase-related amidase